MTLWYGVLQVGLYPLLGLIMRGICYGSFLQEVVQIIDMWGVHLKNLCIIQMMRVIGSHGSILFLVYVKGDRKPLMKG